MKNTKLIVIVAVALAAIFSFWNAVANFSKRSQPSNLAPDTRHQTPVARSPVTHSPSPTASGKRVKSRFQDWQGDPFSTGTESAVEMEIPGLSLSGIAWDPQKPQAIINGHIVNRGDEIADYKVEDIQPTVVTLSRGPLKFELKLGRRN